MLQSLLANGAKPRILFLARSRYRLPLEGVSKRKFDALEELLDYRVLASTTMPRQLADGRFSLVKEFRPRFLDGVLFYATLVGRVADELQTFRPSVVVAQSPYEAASALVARWLVRGDAKILAEIHGDWRASTRTYGSAWRRLLVPLADPLARAAIRRADAVRTVSGSTSELVRDNGVEPIDVFPAFSDLEPFLSRPHEPLPDAPRAIFVGTLEPHKNIDVLAEAWRRVASELPAVTLHIVGNGSRAGAVERLCAEFPARVSWSSRLDSAQVIDAIDAATVLVLPSRSEGLPRVIIEAFARGRLVVGTRVSGIAELVEHELNGLLVAPGRADALAEALVRVLGDPSLAERLSLAASRSRDPWPATPRAYAERVRMVVDRLVTPAAEPRVLFVSRTVYRLPLGESLARKWDALSERMEVRVLASGTGEDPRFRLVDRRRRLDGPRFYAGLPVRVAAELRRFRPEVVITQSPYEAVAVELARRVIRSPVRVVVEVHGDWHVSTRLYGSRYRAALGPLGDRLASWAVRRADASRALSPFTASLVRAEGREADAVFATYSDLGAFAGPLEPLPEEQRLVFVGVLERYKNVDGLAKAWRLVAARLPRARLHVIGSGSQMELVRSLTSDGVEWERWVEPPGVAEALDRSRALVLPSRSEGLGRVIVEAFLRGRPVIASRVGGIPDLVEHDVNGLLVDVGDADALAAAIERVLTEPGLAERLGSAASATASRLIETPDGYADAVRGMVDGVLKHDPQSATSQPRHATVSHANN